MQRLRLIAIMTAIIFLIGSLPARADTGSFKVLINQQELTITSPTPQPELIKDRVYVPLRVISEQLGADVQWDGSNQQVLITRPGKSEIAAPIREPGDRELRIVVDGLPQIIDASLGKPFIKSPGYTMVPLRAVFDALDCDVDWDNAARTVIVESKPIVSPPIEDPVVIPEIPAVEPTNPPQYVLPSTLLAELASYSTNLKLLDGKVINSSSLQGRAESEFTPAQIEQFNKQLSEIKKYPRLVTLPNGQQIDTYNLNIMGNSVATAEQLQQWAQSNARRIQQGKNLPLTPIPDLAALYLKIGAEYGVRGDLAYCQAAKETGYWQFLGQVRPEQNNYCGLYAIGSPLTGNESLGGADPDLVWFTAGTHGAWFTSPEAGVEAQIQHLYGYATANPLPTGKVIVDPRYKLVSKGIASTWTGLNARWAVPGTTYGQSIIHDYWLKALTLDQ